MVKQNETGSLLDGLLPTGEENGMGQDSRVTDVSHGAGGSFPSPAAPEGSGTPGWRYVSWLPSFSVEQSHTQLPRHQQASAQPASTSQLDGLARQVWSHILCGKRMYSIQSCHHIVLIRNKVSNSYEIYFRVKHIHEIFSGTADVS